MAWLPVDVGQVEALVLVITSFFTSMLTAAIGIGGGLTMLAVMAQMLPAIAIVPVHGVVQLGSNTGRAWIMRKDILIQAALWFMLGSLVGAFVGGQIVVSIPKHSLQVMMALFILYATWGPKPKAVLPGKLGMIVAGGGSTLLTMFVGATGPFVMTFVKTLGLNRVQMVATAAGCMVVQHTLKVIVFGLLGFSFGAYVPLMALMIASGFMGTLVGRRLLEKFNEVFFSRLLNTVLTILALRLLWVGVRPFFS